MDVYNTIQRSLQVVASLYLATNLLPYQRFGPRADGISWGPCPDVPTDGFECGYFEVPLDWANESAGKARLAVAKYGATSSPKKGTLLANPGGPGGSGVNFTLDHGQLLSTLTGGYYDIVSWDPRGVGHTIPGPINCFDSLHEYKTFWNGTSADTEMGNKYGFVDLKYFISQVGVMEERWKALGEVCLKHESGQFLPYVGTTATVRDVVAIAETLDGKGCDINYYGLDYGTIIGIYLANMFPDRVGRIVLDGMRDPVAHASVPAHLSWAHLAGSFEETFQGFAYGCALAGPYGCPLATKADKGSDIIRRTMRLFQFAQNYVGSGGTNEYKHFPSNFYQTLYNPDQWASFASGEFYNFAREIIRDNPFSWPAATHPVQDPPESKRESSKDWPAYTPQAIICGDSIDESNITTRAVFYELFRVVKDVSPLFGGHFPQPYHFCHRWFTHAVERFTGPWNSTLKNPIIIIGNKADPAARFLDAPLVAGWLGDSATFVEQDGFGHLTLAQKSTCTRNIISNFFVNGVRPVGDDAVCAIDPDGPEFFPSEGVKASDIRRAISGGGCTSSPPSPKVVDHKVGRDSWFTVPRVLFVFSSFINVVALCYLVEPDICCCIFFMLLSVWFIVLVWYLMASMTCGC